MTSGTSFQDMYDELLCDIAGPLVNWAKFSDVEVMTTSLELVGVDHAVISTKVRERVKIDKNAMKHLQSLIIFGLMRGSGGQKTWSMVYNSCSPAGARALQSAVDYFDVKTGSHRRTRETITIPRLMQAFPRLTWNIHWAIAKSRNYIHWATAKSRKYVHGTVNTGSLPLCFRTVYTGSLPLCFRYSGSPAIMNQEVWNLYGKDYVQFSLSLGKLLKSYQTQANVERYAKLAFEGNAIELANRVSMEDVLERINEYNLLVEKCALEDGGRKGREEQETKREEEYTSKTKSSEEEEEQSAKARDEEEGKKAGVDIKSESDPVNQ